MAEKLKVFHLLGVIMFFGSILAHTVASIFASLSDDPQILYIVRQVMQAETKFLLIPGIFIFLLSGIAMIKVKKIKLKNCRWLMVHAVIGVLVVLNAFFILLPAGQELLDLSLQVANGTLPIEGLQTVKKTESIFGGINLILCLLLIILGVIKPKLGIK